MFERTWKLLLPRQYETLSPEKGPRSGPAVRQRIHSAGRAREEILAGLEAVKSPQPTYWDSGTVPRFRIHQQYQPEPNSGGPATRRARTCRSQVATTEAQGPRDQSRMPLPVPKIRLRYLGDRDRRARPTTSIPHHLWKSVLTMPRRPNGLFHDHLFESRAG